MIERGEVEQCARALVLGIADRLPWDELDVLAGDLREAIEERAEKCPGAGEVPPRGVSTTMGIGVDAPDCTKAPRGVQASPS